MKLVFVTGNITAFPVVEYLRQKQFLCGLVLQNNLIEAQPQIEVAMRGMGINVNSCNENDYVHSIQEMLNATDADMVIVYGFSWMLPKRILDQTVHGTFNIHFSLLPFFKGPTPVFWQLRCGEEFTGITIHKMTEKPDAGPISVQKPVQIQPGDTNGWLNIKLASQLVGVLDLFFTEKKFLPENFMKEEEPVGSYHKRPEMADLFIKWDVLNYHEVEALVQACNPVYGGAITLFQGQELRVFDVVGKAGPDTEGNVAPGTILLMGAERSVMVKCKMGLVELKVIGMAAGIMQAAKWAQLFNVYTGQQFNK